MQTPRQYVKSIKTDYIKATLEYLKVAQLREAVNSSTVVTFLPYAIGLSSTQ